MPQNYNLAKEDNHHEWGYSRHLFRSCPHRKLFCLDRSHSCLCSIMIAFWSSSFMCFPSLDTCLVGSHLICTLNVGFCIFYIRFHVCLCLDECVFGFKLEMQHIRFYVNPIDKSKLKIKAMMMMFMQTYVFNLLSKHCTHYDCYGCIIC